MKKAIFTYILCLISLLALFGCSNSVNTNSADITQNTENAQTESSPVSTENAGNTGKFFEVTSSDFIDRLTGELGANSIKKDNEETEDGLTYINCTLTDSTNQTSSQNPVQSIIRANQDTKKIKSVSLMGTSPDPKSKTTSGVMKYAAKVACIFDSTLDSKTFNQKFNLSDAKNGELSKEINGIVFSYSNSNNSEILSIFYPSQG